MALGTEVDIQIHRGDDRSITGTVVDEAGVAVDITGATMTWVVTAIDSNLSPSQPKKGVTPLFTAKTIGSGITIVSAVDGTIQIALDSADTVGLTAPKKYYHELQMVLAALTTTVMFGKFELVRENIAPGP
ncbi:hypothetical protein LCGC14_1863560 [marine sediment metagenome]|uniref:Uncharacterized protein n=1 Tax=marine sediment metagenome TaxID=412755 RepID=A0A0F9J5R6_9ZZZZ